MEDSPRHETFPTLYTNRLVLRKVDLEDAPELYAYYSDPSVTRYMDWYGPSSVEEAEALIQHWDGMHTREEGIGWGITYQERLIGTIVFAPIRGRFDSNPLYPTTIGFELSKAYWNQGLMTEVLQHVLHYAFTTAKTHRIQAEVIPENGASLSLLAKFGFRQEGVLRRYLYHEGTQTFNDIILLSLLVEDYLIDQGLLPPSD